MEVLETSFSLKLLFHEKNFLNKLLEEKELQQQQLADEINELIIKINDVASAMYYLEGQNEHEIPEENKGIVETAALAKEEFLKQENSLSIDTSKPLLHQIRQILDQKPGATKLEIADILGMKKTELTQPLYKMLNVTNKIKLEGDKYFLAPPEKSRVSTKPKIVNSRDKPYRKLEDRLLEAIKNNPGLKYKELAELVESREKSTATRLTFMVQDKKVENENGLYYLFGTSKTENIQEEIHDDEEPKLVKDMIFELLQDGVPRQLFEIKAAINRIPGQAVSQLELENKIEKVDGYWQLKHPEEIKSLEQPKSELITDDDPTPVEVPNPSTCNICGFSTLNEEKAAEHSCEKLRERVIDLMRDQKGRTQKDICYEMGTKTAKAVVRVLLAEKQLFLGDDNLYYFNATKSLPKTQQVLKMLEDGKGRTNAEIQKEIGTHVSTTHLTADGRVEQKHGLFFKGQNGKKSDIHNKIPEDKEIIRLLELNPGGLLLSRISAEFHLDATELKNTMSRLISEKRVRYMTGYYHKMVGY